MWKIYENGKTLGTQGSENGTIVLDYEHDEGMRVTLENCGDHFAITYGLYGNMVDTIFGEENELRQTVEGLKIELEYYKYVPNDEECAAISKWCEELYCRRNNSIPEPNDKELDGFNEIRCFSLNHYLIDMFPELKESFNEYTDEDGYYYGSYCTFPDLLKPLVLEAIDNNNSSALIRFINLLEDISFSKDDYIENFFVIGILEDIYFLDEKYKNKIINSMKPNTKEIYLFMEPQFKEFWDEVNLDEKCKIVESGRCPKCGRKLASRVDDGSTQIVYCANCGINYFVTTQFESIANDDKEYTITIEPNKIIDRKKLNVVSKLMGSNYIEVKKLLETGGIFFKGNAIDAKDYYLKLKVNYIDFKIEPEYPFEYLLQRRGWKVK